MLFILAYIGFIPPFKQYICLWGHIWIEFDDTLITHFVMNMAVQGIWIHENVVEGDWVYSIDRPVLYHFNSKFNKDINYLDKTINECTTLSFLVWFQDKKKVQQGYKAICHINNWVHYSPLFVWCHDKDAQKYKAFYHKDNWMQFVPHFFLTLGHVAAFLLKLA